MLLLRVLFNIVYRHHQPGGWEVQGSVSEQLRQLHELCTLVRKLGPVLAHANHFRLQSRTTWVTLWKIFVLFSILIGYPVKIVHRDLKTQNRVIITISRAGFKPNFWFYKLMKNQVVNYLYTKFENHKYYLSISVTLNVSIWQSNLTLMNFVRTIKCTGIAIIGTYTLKILLNFWVQNNTMQMVTIVLLTIVPTNI